MSIIATSSVKLRIAHFVFDPGSNPMPLYKLLVYFFCTYSGEEGHDL